MNKIQFKILAALCGMFAWTGCAEEVINERMPEPNSELCIATRSDEGKAIATPVRIYVFNSDDKCVKMEVFTEATNSFTAKLPAGDYSVYAIGGADPVRLALPSEDNATKTSTLSLQNGASFSDLMTANANVTLVANGTNSLTLGMQRKVIMIQSITIMDVPTDATSVSVSISHTYQNILLNGSYTGEEGTFSCELSKQADGTTWLYDTPNTYLLPSVGAPTISVTIGSKTYSYTCQQALEANHKLTIEGKYCDNMFTLSGTITGATWDSEQTIRFQFNTDGTSQTVSEPTHSGSESSSNIPETGTLYHNTYFVLSVNDHEVTLWSPTEKAINFGSSVDLSLVDIELAAYNEQDHTGIWRLPTKTEAKTIIASISKINNLTTPFNTVGYWFSDNGKTDSFSADKGQWKDIGYQGGVNLRPVTTITIE
ncbi:MAG: FimB/Mfa2 family fimbrial subunit [Prevotella sp.]|nr:FimB/Mfa2 family fimbrial subunit [Prevotella sp.]MBQ9216504.1 FimB/Mfa2 family fimbrial subunit [Prevotella sp.]